MTKILALLSLFLFSPFAFAGPVSKTVSVTPVVSASAAYTAADAVGGLMTFAGATGPRLSAMLDTVVVIDEAEQGINLKLYCFDRTFTATNDNAALNISDTDAINLVAYVDVPTASFFDIGGSKIAVVGNVGVRIRTFNSQSVFCQMLTTGTPTFAAVDDITVKLTFVQD